MMVATDNTTAAIHPVMEFFSRISPRPQVRPNRARVHAADFASPLVLRIRHHIVLHFQVIQ